jgi:hypothetical protein
MKIIRQLRRAKLSRKTKKYLRKYDIHIPKLVSGYGYSRHRAEFFALNVDIQIQAHKLGVKPIVVGMERFSECLRWIWKFTAKNNS